MSEKGVKKIGGFIPEIPTRTLSRFPLLQIELQLIIFIFIQNAGSCFVVLVVGFFVCLFDLFFWGGFCFVWNAGHLVANHCHEQSCGCPRCLVLKLQQRPAQRRSKPGLALQLCSCRSSREGAEHLGDLVIKWLLLLVNIQHGRPMHRTQEPVLAPGAVLRTVESLN